MATAKSNSQTLHCWPGTRESTGIPSRKTNVTSNDGGNMDQKTVRKLEEKLEEAIAEIIAGMGLKKLPLLPSQQTMHLMAKGGSDGVRGSG